MAKTPHPSVVVIVTTYNREQLLPEALESALRQSYSPKRIMVVDDGSEDNTPRICEEYGRQYPEELVFFRKSNGGCASARNFGLDHLPSHTDYVCFLDSDDRMLPGKLEREVAMLEAHREAGFCYSDSIIFLHETGKETLSRAAGAGRPAALAIEHFLTNEMKCGAVLYRAETVGERRFPPLFHNEDSDFFQRIALETRGVYCPTPGYWVRDHTTSKSRDLVAIYRAVLQVDRQILVDYPEFHRTYRSLVQERLAQVEHQLFTELARAGRWGEAGPHAKGWRDRLRLFLKLPPSARGTLHGRKATNGEETIV